MELINKAHYHAIGASFHEMGCRRFRDPTRKKIICSGQSGETLNPEFFLHSCSKEKLQKFEALLAKFSRKYMMYHCFAIIDTASMAFHAIGDLVDTETPYCKPQKYPWPDFAPAFAKPTPIHLRVHISIKQSQNHTA